MSTPVASTPSTASPSDRRRRRLASYTVRNMVLSVLPVAALALAWWSIGAGPQEQQTPTAQVAPVAAYAAAEADWPVWVPDPGEGWTPTVAWYDTLEELPTWHLSYTTPDGEYAAIHQAEDVTEAWREAVLAGGEQTGTARLGGPAGEQEWAAFEGPRPSNAERAWVLGPEQTGGSTVVVHGTQGLSQAELTALLGSVTARD